MDQETEPHEDGTAPPALRSRTMRVLLFFVRIPILVLGLFAIGLTLWIFSELVGDSRMREVTGVVTESETVPFGSNMSPPESASMPCRYGSGSAFWADFSTGWFIAEHSEGEVLFCSGPREVGSEVTMWVSPSDTSNGRLVPPTFTIFEAIGSLLIALVVSAGLVTAWIKLR